MTTIKSIRYAEEDYEKIEAQMKIDGYSEYGTWVKAITKERSKVTRIIEKAVEIFIKTWGVSPATYERIYRKIDENPR